MISKKLLPTLSYLLNLSLLLSSCITKEQEAVWEPDVYVGKPDKQAIVRSEDERTIRCMDPKFSEYVCMHSEDVKHMFKVCLDKKD